MTETEKEYNGSTEILRKLSDFAQTKSVSNKVVFSLLVESQIHTIKLIHETNKRLNTYVKDVETIKKDGAKINPKSAILYASIFWGLDRSGVFDSVILFAVKNLDVLWKVFFVG
jgi:hypothetical protein